MVTIVPKVGQSLVHFLRGKESKTTKKVKASAKKNVASSTYSRLRAGGLRSSDAEIIAKEKRTSRRRVRRVYLRGESHPHARCDASSCRPFLPAQRCCRSGKQHRCRFLHRAGNDREGSEPVSATRAGIGDASLRSVYSGNMANSFGPKGLSIGAR